MTLLAILIGTGTVVIAVSLLVESLFDPGQEQDKFMDDILKYLDNDYEDDDE